MDKSPPRTEPSGPALTLVARPPATGTDSGVAQLDTLAALLTGDPSRRATSRYTIPHSRLSCPLSMGHAIASALRPGFGHPAVILRGSFVPAYRGQFSLERVDSRVGALLQTGGGLHGIVLHDGQLSMLLGGLGLDLDSRPTGLLSDNETLILFARRAGREVVVHIGRRGAIDEIRRHHDGLLLAHETLPEEAGIPIPVIQARGSFSGHEFLVQTKLPGSTDTGSADESLPAVQEMLHGLQATTRCDTPSDELGFIENEADILCASMPAEVRGPVSSLVATVRHGLGSEPPPGSLVHGDFWAGNILFDRDHTISGIIDWGWARRRGAPLLDVLHLLASARARKSRRSRASALAAIIDGEAGEETARAIRHSLTFHGLPQQHLYLAARLLILRWIWQGYCLTWSGGAPWLKTLLRDARVHA